MTEDEIKSTLAMCINYSKKMGFINYSQDFAQEAIMELIQGRKASIKHLFVDFLRKHFGDPRTSTYDLQISDRLSPLPVSAGLRELNKKPKDLSIEDVDDGYLPYLSPIEFKYLKLYKKGLSQKEIALKLRLKCMPYHNHLSNILLAYPLLLFPSIASISLKASIDI